MNSHSPAIPDTMRAALVEQSGDANAIISGRTDTPELKAGEVLIKVAAAGVNRPDVVQRQGHYPPPPGASPILGLEVAGEVVAVAEDVTDLHLGDNVCALLSGGGYAEYATADAGLCLPIPSTLSAIEAASLPEVAFTVWFNLVMQGGMASGQTVLIQGGSSGIGSFAIQLAKAMGCKVITTAGNAAKVSACSSWGADIAIDYRQQDFVELTRQAGGCDLVLDMVGGDYINKHIKCCKPGGRIINIAFLMGANVEVNLMPLMLKQLTLTGSTLRSQPLTLKRKIAAEVKQTVWPLIEQGAIRPAVDRSFTLDEASAAHALMESSQHIGKIVLTL